MGRLTRRWHALAARTRGGSATLAGASATVVIVAVALGVALGSSGQAPQWRPPPRGWAAPFVSELNVARARQGLGPLSRCPALDTMARRQVASISTIGYVAHRGQDGAALAARARQAHYRGWQVLGENAAQGLKAPAEVVAAWLVSDEHRRVLLNGAYTHVGVGRLDGQAQDGAPIWTAAFGRGGTC